MTIAVRAEMTVDSWQEFCTGGPGNRNGALEDEQSPLLENFARERIMKLEKGVAGAVLISEM
jgi:hypothetical protein